MHYVKYFDINGVSTKQVACIELQGAPNAATEGAVGVLGMDITSPTHEVYRCVAVNGSVYTWELLSAGMSILSATISCEGESNTSFPYDTLKIPTNYLLKTGDLILDQGGYLYQVSAIGGESCEAKYSGTHLGGAGVGDKDYRLVAKNGRLQLVTENGRVLSEVDTITSDESTIHRDPSTGKAHVIGIKTVDGSLLHIFVGTQEVYDTLTSDQKQNLFAIITDEGSYLQGESKTVTIPEGGDYATVANDFFQYGGTYVCDVTMVVSSAFLSKGVSSTSYVLRMPPEHEGSGSTLVSSTISCQSDLSGNRKFTWLEVNFGLGMMSVSLYSSDPGATSFSKHTGGATLRFRQIDLIQEQEV